MKKTAKKRHPLLTFFLVLLIIVLIVAVAVLYAVTHYVGKLDHQERQATSVTETSGDTVRQHYSTTESEDNAVTNILLIGVDNDYAPGMEELGNADGLIIASVNSRTKQVVLTSLMRDIRVQVPEKGRTKLTLTYHEGGVDELINTIEYNFDIPIDNYALFNYIGLVQIIDAVGGVTMDVTADEIYWMDSKIDNLCKLTGQSYDENKMTTDQAGTVTLNGIQTAAYLRIRYAGNNDFDRTERARNVVLELKNKAAQMSFSELNSLVDTVFPCIITDLSTSDVMSLMVKYPLILKYDMISDRVPIEGSYKLSNEGGNSYVEIDFDANREHLKETIYGE